MGVLITAKNFDITSSIKTFVEDKFERISKKADEETTIRVTLEIDKDSQKAEAILYIAGSPLKMEAVDKDLYVALDKLVGKLNFKVGKMLDKSHERKNDSIRFLEQLNEGDEDTTMEKQPIVKRKLFDMKPMMEEEALLQMNMLGHSFFFFLNGETDTMCLLYKRKDGNYGLIESIR